jgi:hypothetical protein
MQGIAKRGLIWMLAMALVVAGLPMAHAMPDASMPPMQAHGAMHHHSGMMSMSDADHAHHHDGVAMDVASDQDDEGQPSKSDPCKCLNCSMCVTSFVTSPMRLSTPERRIIAVTYPMGSAGAPGIAVRVDPGIPILAM